MARETSVTDLLKKVKSGDRDAADAIVRHFWEVARREAYKTLFADVRRIEDASDIGNASMNSAIKFLRKPQAEIRDRDYFKNLVVDIVRKHAQDANRRETAVMRTVNRRRQLPEGIQKDVPTAEELAVAGELGERVKQLVMQAPDERTKAIRLMGIVSHLKPKQIVEALAEAGRAPALRTVQRDVRDGKKIVAAALRKEYGELLPPKKGKPKAAKKSDKKSEKPSTGKKPIKKAAKKAAKKTGKRPGRRSSKRS